MIYRVWSPDDCDEDGAREIEALSRSEAVQDFVERFDHDDWDDGHIRDYCVRDADGLLWSVDVRAAMTLTFIAREPKLIVENAP